jgi:hypothetical protein
MIEKLSRRFANDLTPEDRQIFQRFRPMVRFRAMNLDRADAEKIFFEVGSSAVGTQLNLSLTDGAQAETQTYRNDRLRNGPIRAGSGDCTISVGSVV